MQDASRDPLTIRQRPLEANLPGASELRLYLAGKLETGFASAVPGVQQTVEFRRSMREWPRTLLIAPPMNAPEGSVKRVIPPLGICYIASSLERQGIPCDILDAVVEGIHHEHYVGDGMWRYGLPPEDVAARVADGGYEVVGLSLLYSSDFDALRDCAHAIKQRRPSTIVVAGGLHASIYPLDLLRELGAGGIPVVDFVIRGEGEERLAMFLSNLKAGTLDLGADGLAGWHDGKLFVNSQRSTLADLDGLPFPAYDKVPLDRYFAFNVPFSPFPRGSRVMQIYTSRGCPVGCTFCASTNFNKAYRARSVDNVLDEIRHYVDEYGIDELQFADDNVTFNRHRSLELFRRLTPFRLPWCTPNGVMVNTLDRELLDVMIESGMYQITLSIDSGSEHTLKHLHRKPVNLGRVGGLISYLHSKNVLVHGTLVVGTIGETLADVQEGFRYADTLDLDSIGVFIAQALPGSEMYETALARGLIDPLRARRIDTARVQLRLSEVESDVLQEQVRTFLYDYNARIARRSPGAWQRKYGAHLDRLASICIGQAAPNTGAVIHAAAAPWSTPTPLGRPR